jgi:hypothetical protein
VHPHADILDLVVATGRRTGIAAAARRALNALNRARVPYAVIGATALAVRGLPRMTRDLDVVVVTEDAHVALGALTKAGFVATPPVEPEREPEAMYVLERRGAEVDLLVASAEPESTVVAEAKKAEVFGVQAPVAGLEHLVLMYLYSNQVRHFGDLARIVTQTDVDLLAVERYLAEVHSEMLPVLRDRVHAARNPPEAPQRPARRRR